MPISQQIGSSSLAKPGVCTSTTRPASPYQGQVIYETDTARTLVWNGSAWVYLSTSTANPVGLEYITQAVFSGSAELNLTSIFSATYDVYQLVFSNFNSSGNCQLYLRMLSGATPLTTNNYQSQRLYAQAASVGGVNTGAIGYGAWGYQVSGFVTGTTLTIYNPFLAQNTTLSASQPYEAGYIEMNNIRVINQVSYDGIRIYPSAASLSGTVRVYGYRQG